MNKLAIFISLVFVSICLFISEPELKLVKTGGLAFFSALCIFFLAQEIENKYVLSLNQVRETGLTNGRYEIPLSKIKILLVVLLGIAFAVLGISMVIDPESFVSTIVRRADIIWITGISIILLGSFGVIFSVVKLFDKTPGLVFLKDGITDNSAIHSVGFISWDDVEDIRTIELASTEFLMFITNKPTKYINKAKNPATKKVLKANNKLYGTPVMIGTTSLMIKFEDLNQLICEEFERYKNTK